MRAIRALATEELHLLGGFHAFGDDGQAEVVRQLVEAGAPQKGIAPLTPASSLLPLS